MKHRVSAFAKRERNQTWTKWKSCFPPTWAAVDFKRNPLPETGVAKAMIRAINSRRTEADRQ